MLTLCILEILMIKICLLIVSFLNQVLLPFFSNYNQCCYEHSCASFSDFTYVFLLGKSLEMEWMSSRVFRIAFYLISHSCCLVLGYL